MMNILRICGPFVNHSKCLNVNWKRQIFVSHNHNVLKRIHSLLRLTSGFPDTGCKNTHDLTLGVLDKAPHRRWKTCISCIHLPHLPIQGPVASYGTKSNKKPASEKTERDGIEYNPCKPQDPCKPPDEDDKNLSIFKRFKKMYRDYWYVLVPVHIITSLGWFGGFYYLVKSGVDVVAALEYIGVSATILEPLKDSQAGYLAVTYALYKIFTPLRYMVTVGGTTISIKHLKEHGYIKPIPPKAKLKEMYQEKKDTLIEKRQNIASGIKQRKDQLKERTESLMRDHRERRKK